MSEEAPRHSCSATLLFNQDANLPDYIPNFVFAAPNTWKICRDETPSKDDPTCSKTYLFIKTRRKNLQMGWN